MMYVINYVRTKDHQIGGNDLRYWASVYFCVHVLALAALGLGLALGRGGPGRRKSGAPAPSPASGKLREE